MEDGNKKKVVQGIIFVVVFIIAFLGTKYILSSFKSTGKEIKKTVKSEEKQ